MAGAIIMDIGGVSGWCMLMKAGYCNSGGNFCSLCECCWWMIVVGIDISLKNGADCGQLCW